jgi:photosystem II stability/assembly factor-like uncharacterized protein
MSVRVIGRNLVGGVVAALLLGAAADPATAQSATTALYSIHMDSAMVGWVSGRNGVVLNTASGGRNWILQPSGTKQDINSVVFVDMRVGWAVGGGGTVLRSTSSGALWNPQSSGIKAALRAVFFLPNGPKDGYAVGDGGTVLVTFDGLSWEAKPSGVTGRLNDVCFVDARTGWAVGEGGVLLMTENHGAGWRAIASGTDQQLNAIVCSRTDVWAVGDAGTVLHSPAQRGDTLGATWAVQKLEAERLTDVFFMPKTTIGWVAERSGRVHKTSDNGITWEYSSLPSNSGDLNALAFVTEETTTYGWAVTGAGVILFSRDAGGSWKEQFRNKGR